MTCAIEETRGRLLPLLVIPSRTRRLVHTPLCPVPPRHLLVTLFLLRPLILRFPSMIPLLPILSSSIPLPRNNSESFCIVILEDPLQLQRVRRVSE
jgi:hypothetical protein